MKETSAWGMAIAAALVLAVGVEEMPKVAVPLTAFIVLIMILTFKG